uniref:Uncharacterized protein n=1 Tax=Arundo donax TaxID=35708 RepID=A0A0A9H7L7_ARUDO
MEHKHYMLAFSFMTKQAIQVQITVVNRIIKFSALCGKLISAYLIASLCCLNIADPKPG